MAHSDFSRTSESAEHEPAPDDSPADSVRAPMQDGVHLSATASRLPAVSSEADGAHSVRKVTEPRRFTAAALICAGAFAAALIALFLLNPAALLHVYVAAPAVLIAGVLVYYLRRARHDRPAEFELQRAHGNGRFKP